MHPNRPTTARRYRVGSGAILAVAILAGIALVLGDAARAAPSGRPTSEPAPQVKPAVDGVFDLFKQKRVVALGDFHGVAQEEAFYCALVRDPRFAEQVGNVVVEFGGSAAQDIIDRYVNGGEVPLTELRHVWTDVVGWLPGPFRLGYINFFANVRAANLKLPPEHWIKIWLGDPKVDWSKINSLRDIAPYLSLRDDNIFRIISDEILKKQKKTLLIVGSGHLVASDFSPGLSGEIAKAYPNSVAVVSPFTGYVEPECNAKLVARAKDRPVPVVVGPIKGTWLKSELQLPGCNYLPLNSPLAPLGRGAGGEGAEQVERMKKMAAAGRAVSGSDQAPLPGQHARPPDQYAIRREFRCDPLPWPAGYSDGIARRSQHLS